MQRCPSVSCPGFLAIVFNVPAWQKITRRNARHDRAADRHFHKGWKYDDLHLHPERGGPFPVILFYMDAPAIREELRDMARRLATSGYYVMLPNLYYRSGVMELGALPADRRACAQADVRADGIADHYQ